MTEQTPRDFLNAFRSAQEEELLPCPHCGGPAEEWAYQIRCAACNLGTPIAGMTSLESSRQRWNRRTVAPALAEGRDG